MECSYCQAELNYHDTYGRGNLAAQEKYGYGWEKLGDIYMCPNAESFDTKEEAEEYLKEINETLESLGIETWEEVSCGSSCHHVSGSFYTDKSGNLNEGYPC